MIQRTQTLLLLAALALMVLMLILPLVELPGGDQIYCYQMIPILFLCIVVSLALAAAILLYKARMIQIRISVFTSVILIGLQAWIGYYLFFDRMIGARFSFISAFPIIAAILTLLAVRYIGRDEAMVRAVSRLRK
ncbi:MAG: DUF4293 domain-containing protein [Prevotellaceae bacterium]|jgi:peptidoglycan/LPS O-acetylase OafA/YrhL|nr:DUF4293 domain-containing protein [Prevotellaceae bacterium]